MTKRSIVMLRSLMVLLVAVLFAGAMPGALAQGPRGAQPALNQLDRQLERAAQLLAGSEDPTLKAMLEQARQLRARAGEEIARGRHEQAAAHIAEARRVLDQLMARLLRSPVHQLGEQLQELLQQAEHVVPGSGNMEAQRLLAQARQQQERAAEALRQQRYQAAGEHYRVALYFGRRALDLVQGGGGAARDRVQEAREQYRLLLEVAEQAVARTGNPMARRSLEQARRHGLLAARTLQRGDAAMAWELYHQSIRMLLRCISLAEGEVATPRQQAEEEVHQVADLLEDASRDVERSPSPEGKFLLAKASELLARAEKNLADGNFALALRNAEFAEAMAYRLLRRNTPQGDALAVRAEEEIDRLRVDIARADKAAADEPQNAELVAQAERLCRQAEGAFERGRYRLALIWVLAGTRLVGPVLGAAAPSGGEAEVAQRMEELDRRLEMASPSWENSEIVLQVRGLREAAARAMERRQPIAAKTMIEIAMELLGKM
ncbi:MAG: hypothetical protein ACUVTG_07385 [Candidatus Oleimicrobiaceae bacterium]